MWVRFPLAWLITTRLNSSVIKLQKLSSNQVENKSFSKLTYVFSSLFSPSSVTNLTLYMRNSTSFNSGGAEKGTFRNRRILIKQSYLLLSWLHVLSKRSNKSGKLRGFAFLPKRRSKYTMTKAPMAHKTFSQEQFSIEYCRVVATTKLPRSSKLDIIPTLLSISDMTNGNLNIGTNLLFLSRVKYTLSTTNVKFFNFHKL